jgi:tRNA1Val (adenine37-N6)-methyltransferase
MQPNKDKEIIEDLQYKGLKIIQNKACFCFGMDAVLLADYPTLKRGDRVLDLCTGGGIVPVLLSGRGKAKQIIGIELMEYVADMGARSVALNGLEGNVTIIQGDVKQARELVDGVFDVVTVNPPYEKKNPALQSPNRYLEAARHEVFVTFDEICQTAVQVLKSGGRLALVHRCWRLAELLCTLKSYNLEPKRMRLVHPKSGEAPNLVLIEAVKDGREGLNVEAPLFVRDETGEYTAEIDRIYHRNEE